MRIPARLTPFVLIAGLVLALSLIATRVLPLLTPRLPQQAPMTKTSGYLDFATPGPARLDADALRILGLDPQAATPPNLHLTWRDQPIPVLPWRGAQGWEVFFNVPAGATRYFPYTTLHWDREAASPTLPTQAPEDTQAQPETTVWTTLHLEQDTRYLPQATTDIPWFWQVLYAPASFTPDLSLPEWAPGPMSVTVRLWSHSSNPSLDPDHQAELYWGDELVQSWTWDGTGMQTLSATWEARQPASLRLETPALQGITSVVFLDALDVRYTTPAQATGHVWQASGGALRLPPVQDEALLLDVTDPLAPIRLHPWNPQALGVHPGHSYWLGQHHQAQTPVRIRATTPLTVPAAKTDYLVIAPEAFHTALAPLLEARQREGLKVALVSPQAVYDAYSYGYPDPEALRTFITSLPALRYALLVGDGSAAVDGYTGEAGALRIVTPYVRTIFVGETPADGWLGANTEGQPRVAIGRWPAQTPADVATIVAKTLAWEANGAQKTLWVSDKEQEFLAMLAGLPRILSDLPAEAIDVAADANATQRLLEALNSAPAWVTYAGHGSLTQLSQDTLLSYQDTWKQPAVFVTWTCLSAYFSHPQQEGMGELWLRQPQGGVVAFIGPTGETTTPEQTSYAQAFYLALQEHPRLGDAWVATLKAGSSSDVRWGFVLLGDPALRWQP